MKTFLHLVSGLKVVVEDDPTGGHYAMVMGLPGCGSQGDSIAETLENVDDVIVTVLEVLREDDPQRLQDLCGSVTKVEVPEPAQTDTTADVGIVTAA